MSDPKNPIRGDEGKEQPIPAETMGFEPHPFDDAETHVLPDDATMPLAKKSPVAPADSGPTQILPGAKLSAAQQEELLETRVVAQTAVPKPVTLPKKPAPAPLPEDDVTIPAPQAYNNQSTRMHATEEAELTRPLMADSEQPTVHAPIQDLNSFAPEYNPDDDATVEYEKNEATARGEVIDALAATLPVVEQTKGRPSTDATKRTNFGAPTENPTRRSSEANRVTNQAARQTKNVPPLQEVPEKHRHYMKLLGKTLDGYFIESLLGAGGMGAVYLAHQVSLDRKVAFKILPEKFAGNPQLLARFTREALSAAQLSHHNIMGVIDIGFAEGIHYISLEFVRGKNIGDITREKGKLPFDEAAGYILQAARGLAYAHDRGMVHRDIKPDNLMLNEHGVIKVADMGLAKMHQWEERPMGMQHYGDDIRLKAMSTDLTQAEVAMGTPAYMSPEQARDTATVDGRSDQYSLGCTFYYLCSGKAPYSGTTAFELMTKHIKEPLIPLSTHVGDVPISIKTIVEKMLHKNPDDRYPNMHEVARQLELYLGVDSSGDFKPREHHLGILERVALEFHNAKGRALRDTVQLGMLILPPLILVICLLSQSLFAIGFGLALGTLVPALAFLTIGFLTRAPLFLRVRRLLFSLGWKTWLQAIVGTGLTVLMLWLVGWLWMWIAMGLLGVAGGFAYWKFLHQPLAKERERILDPLQEVLKELRLRGLSEDKVQFFIMQFAGDSWEELFEALYDYDTKRAARQVREDAKLPKAKKYGVWRDVLINWVEEREAAWRKAR
ncbi:MAG: protein kinase, partial [Candidatus Sumerlaeia bacterium]|nr:protein kinase [Candidatus Sumerlaeia bacterium]